MPDRTSSAVGACDDSFAGETTHEDKSRDLQGISPYYEDEWVTLYHGDCLQMLPALIGDVAVIVTDPPYGLDVALNSGGKKGAIVPRERRVVPEWDRNLDVRDAVLGLCAPRPAIVFASVTKPSPPGVTSLRRPLVWDKGEAVGMGDTAFPWRPNYELIWVIGDGFSGHRGSSILRYPIVPGDRDHPTQKPVALMRDLISKCPVGTVLDPFAGSGSTLRAAKDLGRKAIGIEIEERYCAIAAERIGQEVLFTAPPSPNTLAREPRLKVCRHIYDVDGCEDCRHYNQEAVA